jgi:hypothetical protein
MSIRSGFGGDGDLSRFGGDGDLSRFGGDGRSRQ